MNYQNQGSSSSALAELPVKRKRGRPRKDEGLLQVDNIALVPATFESGKRNKQTVAGTTNVVATSGDMVGQMVTGVIEGSFDAGYLLNVKVGDSNIPLRGVVFLPGRFVPVTASNDVAPQARMYDRNEMPSPIPFPNPQNRADLSEQSREENSKLSVESNKDVSNRIPDRISPTDQLHPSPAPAGMFLLGDLQDKAPPAQKDSKTGLDKEKVIAWEASQLLLEGPNPSILPIPSSDMAGHNPVYGDEKSSCFESKQMNALSPRQDSQLELAKEIMIGDDRFHVSRAAAAFGVATETCPFTTAMSSLSAIMFGQPDSGLLDPKPGSEDSVLRGMVDVQPQVFASSASASASIVDCRAKDPIPPAQL